MHKEIFRVALIGPESSGKTTLAIRLAGHYHTCWVPEFARDFISTLKRPYTKEDILYCAEEQIKSENLFLAMAQEIIFCDTELIVLKIWLLDLYGECPAWLDEIIEANKYDLYVLTKPDIPFVDDPVRENPLRRDYFFDLYKSELEKRNFRYEIIEGENDMRLNNAIEKINMHFKNSVSN